MLRQIMTQVLGLYREHIAGSSIRNLRGLDCRTVRVLESTIRIAVAKVSVLHMLFWKIDKESVKNHQFYNNPELNGICHSIIRISVTKK